MSAGHNTTAIKMIYARLLLIFLVLIALFEIAAVTICFWGQQTVQREIERSAMQNVVFISDTLLSEVQSVGQMRHQLINSHTLTNFVNGWDSLSVSEFYMQIGDICDELQKVLSGNEFIEDIGMYVPAIGRVIGARYYVNATSEETAAALQHLTEAAYPVYAYDDSWHMGICYPSNSLIKGVQPLFFLDFRLSTKRLQKLLDQFYLDEADCVAIVNHSARTALLSGSLTDEALRGYILSSDIAQEESVSGEINIGAQSYYTISRYLPSLNMSIKRYIKMEAITEKPRMFIFGLGAFSVLSMIGVGVYAYMVNRDIKKPIRLLVKAFHELEIGNLDVHIDDKCDYEFAYLAARFNAMTGELSRLIREKYLFELYTQRIELKQLQSQMNPHFFYNSFFMLKRLIQEDETAPAQALASHLGKYFEFITRSDHSIIPLRDEYAHAMEYLSIQKMRFENRIVIEADPLPEKWSALRVPRLIIQPILENTFEHGLSQVAENGLLRMRIREADGDLLLSFEDNGATMTENDISELQNRLILAEKSPSKIETITALPNIHRRLKLFYNGGSGLEAERGELGSLKITLRIPTRGETLDEAMSDTDC